MTKVDDKILKFIKKHHLMNLATVGENGEPYCANVFFAYDSKREVFVFTSSTQTRHGGDLLARQTVAATIALETKVVGRIEGLQIVGEVSPGDDEAKLCYLKTFPFAVVAPLELWSLSARMMKLTDNKLGFGKKIIWNREE